MVIFLDLTLDGGTPVPAELRHRLSCSIAGENGATIEKTLNGPVVAIVQEPAPVLRAPRHGSGWVAFNALSNPDHRRSWVPVDGKVRIAQRLAIDWMRLGPDGRLFHDDSKCNANFYGYGAEVVAVADGRVSDLKDGLPENVGSNESSTRAITLDNIAGNYLILDLGQGRFALYAHLQPGSPRVKLGDKVKAGDVLALLGNSGNSDAPHLHFHLMDANSSLGAERLPYELDTFTQNGVIDDAAVLDSGQAWQPKTQVGTGCSSTGAPRRQCGRDLPRGHYSLPHFFRPGDATTGRLRINRKAGGQACPERSRREVSAPPVWSINPRPSLAESLPRD